MARLHATMACYTFFERSWHVGQMVENLEVNLRQYWINKVIGKKAFMSKYKKL